MPNYDFKCCRCGAMKTVFRSIADADAISVWCDSPNCKPAIPGGVCRMERQPSAPAFKVVGGTPKFHK
jgi:predicted nucleic acid-binding Zn ribbon protein